MKKILKGCLIACLVLIGIVVIIGVGIYLYSKTPNNIVVLSKPLKILDLKDDLYFPEGNIPNFITCAVNRNHCICLPSFLLPDNINLTCHNALVVPAATIVMFKELTGFVFVPDHWQV